MLGSHVKLAQLFLHAGHGSGSLSCRLLHAANCYNRERSLLRVKAVKRPPKKILQRILGVLTCPNKWMSQWAQSISSKMLGLIGSHSWIRQVQTMAFCMITNNILIHANSLILLIMIIWCNLLNKAYVYIYILYIIKCIYTYNHIYIYTHAACVYKIWWYWDILSLCWWDKSTGWGSSTVRLALSLRVQLQQDHHLVTVLAVIVDEAEAVPLEYVCYIHA